MTDDEAMAAAVRRAELAREQSPPNPWVGAVVVADGVVVGEGHTAPPGGPHAEVEALAAAGERAGGATMAVTLEPCAHVGRTPPCVDAIVAAGVARVVVALRDPDERDDGAGVAALRAAGVEVTEGVGAGAAREQLAPYLWHRSTGRPFVVAKVAATLDGVVAMADGTSRWITGEAARRDGHELRAASQAILVGAGTVRADDPELTARLDRPARQPLRVVLGRAPEGARVHPCLERSGDVGAVLDELGSMGVVQLLVEGGPTTWGEFLDAGLVNRVVWYAAPALAGATGTLAALATLTTETMERLRRGRVVGLARLGEDVRLDVEVA